MQFFGMQLYKCVFSVDPNLRTEFPPQCSHEARVLRRRPSAGAMQLSHRSLSQVDLRLVPAKEG